MSIITPQNPTRHDRPIRSPSRRLTPRDVVANYMSTQLDGRIHAALDTVGSPHVQYEQRLGIWRLDNPPTDLDILSQEASSILNPGEDNLDLAEIYAESNLAQQNFLIAMKEYQRDTDVHQQLDMDVTSFHSWDQVLNIVDIAESKYRVDDVKGGLRKVRKAFRSLSKAAKSAQCFTALLPSQSTYGSVLCGGVKLILGAAERIKDMRENIKDALVEIPSILEETNSMMGFYWKSEGLHRATSELYVAVLHAFEYILLWFKQKSAKKVFKATFKQDSYNEELKSRIEEIHRKAKRFKKQSEVCLRLEMRQTHNGVQALLAKGDIEDARLAQIAIAARKIDSLEAATNLLTSLLRENINPPPLLGLNRPMLPVKECHLTADDILHSLEYDPSALFPDLQALLRLSNTLDLVDQNRASALMLDPALREWIISDTSTTLLVNGRGPNHMRSPITLVCATLARSLYSLSEQTEDVIISLSFFCGEHVDSGDYEAHAQGMLLNLLAQLLLQYRAFDFSTVEALWEDMRGNDVRSISRFLAALLSQLPPYAKVFCVVDGVSHYEDMARRRDTCEAIRRLVRMVRRGDGPIIKLLVTSPTNSNHVWRFFERDEVLDMQWEYSNLGGYLASKWMVEMGGVLEEVVGGEDEGKETE